MKKYLFATPLLSLLFMAQPAMAQTFDFESGIQNITGGSGQARWSGTNGVTLDPSKWGGLSTLRGASGNVGDDYVWQWDTVNGGPDYFATQATAPSNINSGISYQFINSSTALTLGAGYTNFIDLAIISADGTLKLAADVFVAPDDMTSWATVTASYNIEITQWRVWNGTSTSGVSGWTLATQEQVNSIILSSNWTVLFGFEQITGGVGASGPEFMAVDNLNIGTQQVPEPGSAALLVMTLAAGGAANRFLRRRRSGV